MRETRHSFRAFKAVKGTPDTLANKQDITCIAQYNLLLVPLQMFDELTRHKKNAWQFHLINTRIIAIHICPIALCFLKNGILFTNLQKPLLESWSKQSILHQRNGSNEHKKELQYHIIECDNDLFICSIIWDVGPKCRGLIVKHFPNNAYISTKETYPCYSTQHLNHRDTQTNDHAN